MPLGANKVALYGASADTGTAVLLSTATASNDASIEFTGIFTDAYKQYCIGFYSCYPHTNEADLCFQVNASGQSGYNETITSSAFWARHDESGSSSGLSYSTSHDQAQGTSFQNIGFDQPYHADAAYFGHMMIFNPASTTYVKHFYSRVLTSDQSRDIFSAGYINNSAAISDLKVQMSSGNITGTVKVWGIS